MTSMRWALMTVFLAALATNASCGRKGDPKPPEAQAVQTEDEEKGESGY